MHFVLYVSFCSTANSEGIDQANSCTSSSNESVSSPPVWNTDNHNKYPADSPQKSKRGEHQVLKIFITNNIVFKHSCCVSQTILSCTMQLIYFRLLLFAFTTCFSRIWPSSGVLLPKTVTLYGISRFFYHI
jgi:hypothetical protein